MLSVHVCMYMDYCGVQAPPLPDPDDFQKLPLSVTRVSSLLQNHTRLIVSEILQHLDFAIVCQIYWKFYWNL